ncbi:hypothetical protein ACTXT7_001190 [Hymenolepis weldensis]
MSIDEDDLAKTDSNTKSEESTNQPTLPKPKFFMNCSNGSHIVLPQLNRLGWNRVTSINDIENCFLRWTETVTQQNYLDFKEDIHVYLVTAFDVL